MMALFPKCFVCGPKKFHRLRKVSLQIWEYEKLGREVEQKDPEEGWQRGTYSWVVLTRKLASKETTGLSHMSRGAYW